MLTSTIAMLAGTNTASDRPYKIVKPDALDAQAAYKPHVHDRRRIGHQSHRDERHRAFSGLLYHHLPRGRLLARLRGNTAVVFDAAVTRKVEDCLFTEHAIIQIDFGDDQFILFCFCNAEDFTVGIDNTTFAE